MFALPMNPLPAGKEFLNYHNPAIDSSKKSIITLFFGALLEFCFLI
jgi:hypothetical protein